MSSSRSDQIIWLDTLEGDFDDAVRHLELTFNDSSLQQFSSTLVKAKDKIRTIVGAFTQLIHKSQSVLQSNCKLEALLMDMRSQLVKQKAAADVLDKEVKARRLEVKNLELQLRNSKQPDDSGICKELDTLRAQLELEIENFVQDQKNFQEVHSLAEQLESENNMLHEYMEEAHSDLSAAKLHSRYMEKELAGRVQQLQLVGSGVSQERFNKLWMELNAEIEVQRHKAVIKTKKSTTNPFKAMRIPLPNKTSSARQNLIIGRFPTRKAYSGILDSCVRKVVVTKEKGSSLGMSITGGAEHGVPILVSDLQSGKPAHSCGLLRIGDAILSVNGHNLRNCYHRDAVSVLQSVGEEVVMEVVYVADLVSDNSDDEGETQERQSPSEMIPSVQLHNEENCEPSGSSESEYDSPDSSVEPDHFTSLPTSSLPSSSASVLCKPRRAPQQQQPHKLMASFDSSYNGLQAHTEMAHPDDHSDGNSNYNNSSTTNYSLFYTDNPHATVVASIELGPNDIPKGKNKPARV